MSNINLKEIEDALHLISYSDSDIFDNLFSDEYIITSRVHLGIIGEKNSPFQKSGVYSWIEGEIYNLDEIKSLYKYKSNSFSELLIDAFKKNELTSILSKIDGCFTAILYDKSEIKLISDRYGMKPLYIWKDNGNFVWVSEVKALLALQCFKPEINTKAIKCFLEMGYLLGDITWFKNVNLINSASIITYSLKERKIVNENRYWKWSSIKPINIPLNKAVIRLSNLLKTAVKKRVNFGERLGVTLSGGIDSRLNLATIDQINNMQVKYITFGKKGSDDIKIAKMVSSLKNNSHIIFEMNEKNWIDNRFHHIWRSDGMLTLLQLQNPISKKHLKALFDIVIGGNLGEIFKGEWVVELDKRITKKIAYNRFGNNTKLTNLDDDFYDIPHQDPYTLDNRGRRFINIGLIGSFSIFEIRRPLLDNNLIEFIYALPDSYRKGGRIYEKALLYKYPKYYEKIPWQNTGYPISKKMTIHRKICLLIKKILIKFPIIKISRDFTDYPNWLRTPDMIKFMKEILNPNNALYSNYSNENFIKKYVEPHCQKANLIYIFLDMIKFFIYSIKEFALKLFRTSSKRLQSIFKNYTPQHNYDYSHNICNVLTMEIWFQQVFNKKYRN